MLFSMSALIDLAADTVNLVFVLNDVIRIDFFMFPSKREIVSPIIIGKTNNTG